MDGIRRLFVAVAFLLLVASPSAALNILPSLDVDEPEIWLGLDPHALEIDREAWTLFMIDDPISELDLERPAAGSSDESDYWEISLTRVWERP